MDLFTMHHNYENKYLVVIIDSIVYVYKNKIYKFVPPLFIFQAKMFLLVNQSFVL